MQSDISTLKFIRVFIKKKTSLHLDYKGTTINFQSLFETVHAK